MSNMRDETRKLTYIPEFELFKAELKPRGNLVLSPNLTEIMRPLSTQNSLTYTAWLKEINHKNRNGLLAHYIRRLLDAGFLHLENKHYSITERGIMLYCILTDTSIDAFIALRMQEVEEITQELIKIKRRIKGFYK